MKFNYLLYILVVFSVVIFGCAQKRAENTIENTEMKNGNEYPEFKKICQEAGYEWMLMKPTQDGKFIKDANECWGCMVEGLEHVCDKEKFMEYIKNE